LHNPVSIIRHPTRLNTDLESLSYWIFAQYAHLPRDFTIFISKVYDFFETKEVAFPSSCAELVFKSVVVVALYQAALSRLRARSILGWCLRARQAGRPVMKHIGKAVSPVCTTSVVNHVLSQ